LTDTHSASVGSSVNGTTYSNKTLYVQESYYRLQGPMQYDFSGAVFIGKKGIISADYGIASYTGMKLRDDNGRSNTFSAENQNIKNNLQDAYTLRVGAEYKVSDEVSLRCGYANVSSSTKDNASKSIPLNSTRTDVEYFLDGKTNYYTAGIGYHENNWFLDFVFMKEVSDQDYYPYSSDPNNSLTQVNPASITTTTNNFLVTVGLKY
jgi:opacity protein-like surface antigen